MTQEELAMYLKVSQQLITAVENGLRDLPLDRLAALMRLEQAFYLHDTITTEMIPSGETAIRDALQKLIDKRRYEVKRKTFLLKKLEASFQEGLKTMMTLESFKKNLPANPDANAARHEMLWIDIQLDKARKSISPARQAEIELLKLKIAALTYEADAAEKRLNGIEGQQAEVLQ